MERIKSGIKGLDRLTGGGIPRKDIILLTGTCGAGKTVFGLQFLYSRAKEEPGIFVSFEEDLDQVRETGKSFGWDVEGLEDDDKLRLVKYDPFRLEDIIEIVEHEIREIGARRVVVDSVAALGLYMGDPSELRRMLLQLSTIMRKNSCTTILISEIPPGHSSISRFEVEEFVTDGVIVLRNYQAGARHLRGLSIWKLRATDHSKRIHPYKIDKKGFSVQSTTLKL